MSLLNKLNIKPTKTITKTGAKTLEKQINEVFKNACLDAIRNHSEFKKYLVNIKKTDVFKQVIKKDGSKDLDRIFKKYENRAKGGRAGYKGGKLVGKQKNLDVAAPFGKITGADFKKLRSK